MRDITKIGETIKILREKKDIKQKDLADKIGIKKTSLSKIENGNQIPSLKQIVEIAKALNVKENAILGIYEESNFINRLRKEFKKITTSTKYFNDNCEVFEKDELVFQTNEEFLVITCNKALFNTIKEIADIENSKDKLKTNEYSNRIFKMRENYRKEIAENKTQNYFLITGEQMSELVKNSLEKQDYFDNLMKTLQSEES